MAYDFIKCLLSNLPVIVYLSRFFPFSFCSFHFLFLLLCSHKRNSANNSTRPWALRTQAASILPPHKMQVFIFSVFTPPKQPFWKCLYFVFSSRQLSSQKKKNKKDLRYKKYWWRKFAPSCTPWLRLWGESFTFLAAGYKVTAVIPALTYSLHGAESFLTS